MRDGVRVVAVNPGLIITDRMGDLLRRRAIDELGDESRWEELIPADPAPGTVEQVADVVAFPRVRPGESRQRHIDHHRRRRIRSLRNAAARRGFSGSLVSRGEGTG